MSYENDYKLRVKRKNLADEARTIKDEERKAKAEGRVGYGSKHAKLYRHRIDIVRPESRAAHLAHAFLSGTPYAAAEQGHRPNNPVPVRRLVKIAKKYGRGITEEAVQAWLKAPRAVEVAA